MACMGSAMNYIISGNKSRKGLTNKSVKCGVAFM